jgi:transcriptional regulator GlxA family with amidase domain
MSLAHGKTEPRNERLFAHLQNMTTTLNTMDRSDFRNRTITLQPRLRSAASPDPATWEGLAAASKFRLKILAGLCQVSVRTLQRHFRKEYDLAVSEWLREIRLEQARQMLTTSDCVKTVCFELGYKQQSHFTRDFSRRYGIAPSLWRRFNQSPGEIPVRPPC